MADAVQPVLYNVLHTTNPEPVDVIGKKINNSPSPTTG
jgi:hypothetical protein